MNNADFHGDLRIGDDGQSRCWWYGGHTDYRSYHDSEWGRPVLDDQNLFEKICLEGFQSGLSWLTILRKRESFRTAFLGFDIERVANFGPGDVQRLLGDAGIVRHRGKIQSTINNAGLALRLQAEFGSLAHFFWSFEPELRKRPKKITRKVITALTSTDASQALAKELKRRGWSFVGPTTMYAFMQAMGLVNDHVDGCFCRAEAEAERNRVRRP